MEDDVEPIWLYSTRGFQSFSVDGIKNFFMASLFTVDLFCVLSHLFSAGLKAAV